MAKLTVGVMFNCIPASQNDRQIVFKKLSTAGVQWVRINVNWMDIQPIDANNYDSTLMASLDDCINIARSVGLKILIVYLATPAWARTGPNWNSPPTNPSLYASSLRYLVARYGNSVQAWEIWNEEDTKVFWAGNVSDYINLLRLSYKAVKSVNSNALIVFGGTAHNDTDFIANAYKAGAKGLFDVMATHPYPRSNVPEFSHAEAVHQVMVKNDDGNKPIWFTEFGWSAPFSVTLTQQASYLTQSYNYIQSKQPYVINAFWFQAINEVPSVANQWEGDCSLINPNLTSRPALSALAHWVKLNG